MKPKPTPQVPKTNMLTLLTWMALIFMSVQLMTLFVKRNEAQPIPFKDFIEKVKNKEVQSVTIKNEQEIVGELKNVPGTGPAKNFTTIGDPRSEVFLKIMLDNGIVPNYIKKEEPSMFFTLLITFLPILIIIGFFIYMMRGQAGAAGKITSFGKVRTKVSNPADSKISFGDVAGCDEAKEELKEFVDFLSNPQKFTRLGGKLPKGALLVGPPGTGKTLLAKAVAAEAGVPFFSLSGSDFVEMFVGVGASRVRDLFEQAKNAAPCIIFIDEIDAVGRARGGGGIGGGHDERDQTLNQLLVEMDGFDSQKGIVVLAATNRVDVLDQALLRPGRFDRRVMVSLPDVVGREKILQIHASKTKIADAGSSLKEIAKGTPGFSGADLANLINEAAIVAARRNKEAIDKYDLEEARDKVLMGPQRRSMVLSHKEKETTAIHEAGHTIIAKYLKTDAIHKVSIIPRGMALGVTQTLPEDNRLSLSKEQAENMISMLMGGRIAEEIVFKHYTTGASNDIEKATELARRMVCEWGMSTLGPINYYTEANPLAAKAGAHDFSSDTKKLIDEEIKKIIDTSYKKASEIISTNIETLKKLSNYLLERETLDAQEVQDIFEGKELLARKESLN